MPIFLVDMQKLGEFIARGKVRHFLEKDANATTSTITDWSFRKKWKRWHFPSNEFFVTFFSLSPSFNRCKWSQMFTPQTTISVHYFGIACPFICTDDLWGSDINFCKEIGLSLLNSAVLCTQYTHSKYVQNLHVRSICICIDWTKQLFARRKCVDCELT